MHAVNLKTLRTGTHVPRSIQPLLGVCGVDERVGLNSLRLPVLCGTDGVDLGILTIRSLPFFIIFVYKVF